MWPTQSVQQAVATGPKATLRDTYPPSAAIPPTPSRSSEARAAADELKAAAGSALFILKEQRGTAGHKRVFPCCRGSQDARFPSVSDDVPTEADAVGSRGSARRPLQGRDGFPSSAGAVRKALTPVSVKHTGQDSEVDDASSNP
ncbi:hypothetical protein HGM15179_016898 [Zosterops borbonicus]|uniref:Uncharacterized protein n=1 Tax=Zosterops borbonicus TaxID=364589 RepID=A0A8K1G1X7_9PASS|nr:hypothetical protein HGM15179_016898 [Zosterops borbonicus]